MRIMRMLIVLVSIVLGPIVSNAGTCDDHGADFAVGGIQHGSSWENQTDTVPDVVENGLYVCSLHWRFDLFLADVDGVQGKAVWQDQDVDFTHSSWYYYNWQWNTPMDSESCWYTAFTGDTSCGGVETSYYTNDVLYERDWVEQFWRITGHSGWNYFHFQDE